jgi:hypothetical protein
MTSNSPTNVAACLSDYELCAICSESLFGDPTRRHDDDNNSTTLSWGATVPCGHVYHASCLAAWQQHAEATKGSMPCPLCSNAIVQWIRLFQPTSMPTIVCSECRLVSAQQEIQTLKRKHEESLKTMEAMSRNRSNNMDREEVGTHVREPSKEETVMWGLIILVLVGLVVRLVVRGSVEGDEACFPSS